jgi:FkbM family methyltransferase
MDLTTKAINRVLKTIDYKHGKLWIYDDDQIEQNINKDDTRSYQEHIVKALHTWAIPGTTVLDVGANIGVFTIPMSKYVGEKGKVYSFEPVSHTFALLQKNVELNGLTNVTCMPIALSNENETKTIYNFSNPGNFSLGHSTLYNAENSVPIFTETIKCMKLDDYELDNISFIKVDIEKHEPFFIQGALKTLHRCRPALVLELPHRNPYEKTKFKNCCELLKPINYVFIKYISSKDALFLHTKKKAIPKKSISKPIITSKPKPNLKPKAN